MRYQANIDDTGGGVAVATECHSRSGFDFQRKIVVDFEGGEITGDAGLVLRYASSTSGSASPQASVSWSPTSGTGVTSAIRSSIYCGSGFTRSRLVTRTPTMRRSCATTLRCERSLAEADRPLASQPTLSRMENAADWDSIRLLEREGLEWLCRIGGAIDGRRRDSSEELILDIDSSEDPTHGQQELAFFNGHYDSWMYHPLFVFEGGVGMLLAARLRPGDVGGIRQLLGILRPTVRRLQARFPKRPVAIRADGDFAKSPLLDYAEYAGCSGTIGMPRNPKLEERVEKLRHKAEVRWKEDALTGFASASSSDQTRKLGYGLGGSWRRSSTTPSGRIFSFVVTNRTGCAEGIFDWYEQRGQAENYIKDLKNEVAADRLSCSSYRANQLPGSSFTRSPTISSCSLCLALRATSLASATIGTIRLRLLKVGARVVRSVRRLWFHIASGWPWATALSRRLRSRRCARRADLIAEPDSDNRWRRCAAMHPIARAAILPAPSRRTGGIDYATDDSSPVIRADLYVVGTSPRRHCRAHE